MKKKLVTVDELAKYLGKSRSYIYKKTSKKKIPFYRWQGSIYFDLEEIVDLIKKDKEQPRTVFL